MTTAVVLGAGGSLGWAFHLGVVEGLASSLGLTPATVDRLIGTSAGGTVAAAVLTGADSESTLAAVARPLDPEQQARMAEIRARAQSRRWSRWLRPQAPGLIRRGGVVGLVGLLPAGAFPTFPLRRFPSPDRPWPSNLWLPAVSLADGSTMVFGRDRTDVAVADAMEASSAVPLLFQPKEIDGVRYVDGAVASATHTGLLLDGTEPTPDLVIIASPMTRPGRGPVRLRARRQLRREVARLRASGSTVIVIEPDDDLMAIAQGFPRRNGDAGPAIVAAARALTESALAATTS